MSFVWLMSSLMFLILFLANALRVLKESLLVTHIGIESLSYLRILLQLPLSLLVIYLLTELKKKYTQQRIFSLAIWFYIIFMFIFTNILYPYIEALGLPVWLKDYLIKLPPASSRLVPLIDFWPITLLYLLAELWPLLIYVNCFWELSNRLVNTEEAAQIYPRYNILGQANILFTGLVLYYLSACSVKHYISAWGFNFVQCLGSMAFLVMAIVLLLYNYIIARYTPLHTTDGKAVSTGKKLSFRQTLKLLHNHQHIANIFVCTLLYYAVISAVQTVWLYTLSIHYTTPSLLSSYQSQTLLMVGVSTLFFALIGKRLLNYLGWYLVLQILPFTMLVFSVGMILGYAELLLTYRPLTTLYLSTGMYMLAKSMKYTFFDATKEMAYIPADDSVKFYGKLSADTLANSLGKVLGNILPILFFTCYWERSFDRTMAVWLSFLLVLLSGYWIFMAGQLRRSYCHVLQSKATQAAMHAA